MLKMILGKPGGLLGKPGQIIRYLLPLSFLQFTNQTTPIILKYMLRALINVPVHRVLHRVLV